MLHNKFCFQVVIYSNDKLILIVQIFREIRILKYNYSISIIHMLLFNMILIWIRIF